jgi:hypothetical protein
MQPPNETDQNKKRSINLGQKLLPESLSLLPPKLGLTELLRYREGILVRQILNSNTFFHGKVGFFELVMRKIYEIGGETLSECDYLHTAYNLPKAKSPPRLILMPNVKSEDELNDFVAKSLRHKSRSPVWLIANPSSIEKHLLSRFHNFFIASNNPKETEYLQSIFSLPKVTFDLLLSNERESVFITDFEPLINRSYFPIAFARLDGFD